jgi:hypothetical protein
VAELELLYLVVELRFARCKRGLFNLGRRRPTLELGELSLDVFDRLLLGLGLVFLPGLVLPLRGCRFRPKPSTSLRFAQSIDLSLYPVALGSELRDSRGPGRRLRQSFDFGIQLLSLMNQLLDGRVVRFGGGLAVRIVDEDSISPDEVRVGRSSRPNRRARAVRR